MLHIRWGIYLRIRQKHIYFYLCRMFYYTSNKGFKREAVFPQSCEYERGPCYKCLPIPTSLNSNIYEEVARHLSPLCIKLWTESGFTYRLISIPGNCHKNLPSQKWYITTSSYYSLISIKQISLRHIKNRWRTFSTRREVSTSPKNHSKIFLRHCDPLICEHSDFYWPRTFRGDWADL